ncbi:PaaI family thioesterase [Kutzneria sp. CA-103260]|uniref:PaaI family thioesterase n=1 Tax=Kutzneria sp. CA-103260 TaxID=2802641 RepID=UPI001BA875E9|nr:PaaI family thioesterase [Kutzneria sp. CA-103260]QUQ62762.1 aromatic compounds degradation protein paaI [Kutzneria sp. CA-103260]
MSAVDTKELSGLELLRWVQSERPAGFPAIQQLFGLTFETVDPGRMVVSVATRPEFGNTMGTVHGGVLATLLDTAMSCAVHTTLPAGVGYTTLEIKVNYVRAAHTDGRLLTTEGVVVHAGRRTATAEGRVTDAEGRLIAHASTTCLILDKAS